MRLVTPLTILLGFPVPGAAFAGTFDEAYTAGAALGTIEALRDVADESCATVEVMALQRGFADLTPAAQARAQALLGAAAWADGGEGAVPRGNVDCALELASVVESEHFTVEWGPLVNLPEGTAEFMLGALEEIRLKFLDGGYDEPAGNPSQKVPFYFGNSGGNSPSIGFDGGYTTMCAGGEHAYVVMSDIRTDEGSVELATHELFHAVQMGGPAPNPVDGWYWEASATWAEDFVQPDWNTHAWVLSAFTGGVELPLADESVFLHRYGLFLYVAFLAEHAPGGLDLVRHVWTTDSRGGLADRLEEYWLSIDDRTDFAEQFGHFTAKTAVMDYEDHSVYVSDSVPPREVLSPPHTLSDVTGTGLYGSHYYQVDASGAAGTKLRVIFQGHDDRQWIVGTARSPDGRTAVSTQMYLDRSGGETLDLLDIGTTYEDTWIIVTRIGDEPSSYDLQLEFLDQTEAPGSDLLPDDESGGSRTVTGTACGGVHPFAWPLASLADGEPAWLALLLLPFVCRRRTAP